MTITINGREYSVEVLPPDDRHIALSARGLPRYRLTGKRGAVYNTMRSIPHPERMFLVAFHPGQAFPCTVDPLGRNVWLTDEGGELRQLR